MGLNDGKNVIEVITLKVTQLPFFAAVSRMFYFLTSMSLLTLRAQKNILVAPMSPINNKCNLRTKTQV